MKFIVIRVDSTARCFHSAVGCCPSSRFFLSSRWFRASPERSTRGGSLLRRGREAPDRFQILNRFRLGIRDFRAMIPPVFHARHP